MINIYKILIFILFINKIFTLKYFNGDDHGKFFPNSWVTFELEDDEAPTDLVFKNSINEHIDLYINPVGSDDNSKLGEKITVFTNMKNGEIRSCANCLPIHGKITVVKTGTKDILGPKLQVTQDPTNRIGLIPNVGLEKDTNGNPMLVPNNYITPSFRCTYIAQMRQVTYQGNAVAQNITRVKYGKCQTPYSISGYQYEIGAPFGLKKVTRAYKVGKKEVVQEIPHKYPEQLAFGLAPYWISTSVPHPTNFKNTVTAGEYVAVTGLFPAYAAFRCFFRNGNGVEIQSEDIYITTFGLLRCYLPGTMNDKLHNGEDFELDTVAYLINNTMKDQVQLREINKGNVATDLVYVSYVPGKRYEVPTGGGTAAILSVTIIFSIGVGVFLGWIFYKPKRAKANMSVPSEQQPVEEKNNTDYGAI